MHGAVSIVSRRGRSGNRLQQADLFSEKESALRRQKQGLPVAEVRERCERLDRGGRDSQVEVYTVYIKKVAVLTGLVAAMLCVAATAEKGKRKARYSQATGPLTAVDAGAKTITVKTRKGEKTLALADKTRIVKLSAAKAADLAKGQLVRVEGRVAEDQKSIDALRIIILPEGEKPRGKGVTKTGALGTIEAVGDTLTVKSKSGETVAVTLLKAPKPTRVLRAAKAAFADLKPGCIVQCNTAEQDGKFRATRVTIRPAEEKAKKKG